MSRKSKKNNKKKTEVGVAAAIASVFIRAIDRDQLVPLGLISIFLLVIYRLSSDKVYEFVVLITNKFADLSIVGWGLSIVLAISWAGHAKLMRKRHSKEYQRIGREKSALQKKLSKLQLKSSDEE